MLVLSRKVGEKVCVGDGVAVTLISIDRAKVRLGFEAPADMPIFREELVGCEPKPKRKKSGAAGSAKGRSGKAEAETDSVAVAGDEPPAEASADG
jgi:carbon storage regulator